MQTTPRLRPLNLGELLDAAFRIYRAQFITLIGISALLQIPMAILQAAGQGLLTNTLMRASEFLDSPLSPPPSSSRSIFEQLPLGDLALFYVFLIAINAIYYVVVNSLIGGALTTAVARTYLATPIGIVEAYRLGARRFVALALAALALGGAILVGFVMLLSGCTVIAFALIGVTGVAQSLDPLAAAVVGGLFVVAVMALVLPLGLLLYTRFQLVIQAIVLEGAGPIAGLGRSWRLVGRAFWRSLLVLVLLGMLAYLVSSLPAWFVSTIVTLAFGVGPESVAISTAAATFVAYLGLILVLPIQYATQTLLFYDLRVRFEGYDLELQTQRSLSEER